MTYIEKNHFALLDKPKPELKHPRDRILVRADFRDSFRRYRSYYWGRPHGDLFPSLRQA